MNPTRALAQALRTTEPVSQADCFSAAAAIDALLDAIEAGGMVQPRPAPVMDLGPLRALRQMHVDAQYSRPDGTKRDTPHAYHRKHIDILNSYFPEGDRL